jgi:hypothetical protein
VQSQPIEQQFVFILLRVQVHHHLVRVHQQRQQEQQKTLAFVNLCVDPALAQDFPNTITVVS